MIKTFLTLVLVSFGTLAMGQGKKYTKQLKAFQQHYSSTHEVVTGADQQYFRFFPVDKQYLVMAVFTKIENDGPVTLRSTGSRAKKYERYGFLQFRLRDTVLQLTVFKSEDLAGDPEYKDYLFLPFTDRTSGEESYGGGRYLDLNIKMIKDNKMLLDFNKAYNPYCAYATGYNCPIPPQENDLPISIRAGEQAFAKEAH